MGRRQGQAARYGGWNVERELGAGGMGTVYLAHKNGQRAAVKVIQPGLAADPEFRARFRREVRLSERVRGPHVACVIDADPDANEPWLAVEYLDGPTLARHVTERGALNAAQATAAALALASALRDIHAAGIVHRDLKPSNVVLAANAPRVIDFGIAAAADGTSLTHTGMVLGSAGWMSPEQLRGDAVTAATDVFSWGATVAYAATGRAPFGTGRPEAAAYRVVNEPPDLAGLDGPLADLASRALDKDPARRPPVEMILATLAPTVGDAPTLADAVTRVWTPVAGVDATTVATPPRPGHRRDRRTLTAATAALVVVFVALIAVAAIRSGSPDTANAADVAPTEAPTTSEPSTTTTTPPSTTTAIPTTTTTAAPTTTVDRRMATTLPADGRPRTTRLGYLRPGDCFGPAMGLDPVSGDATRVPCGLAHDAEVAAMVTLPYTSYPGFDTAADWVGDQCRAEFKAYTGVPLGVEWASLTYAVPEAHEWAGGYREAVCIIVGTEGDPLIGSKRDLRD